MKPANPQIKHLHSLLKLADKEIRGWEKLKEQVAKELRELKRARIKNN